jgi:hypothetical protein
LIFGFAMEYKPKAHSLTPIFFKKAHKIKMDSQAKIQNEMYLHKPRK